MIFWESISPGMYFSVFFSLILKGTRTGAMVYVPTLSARSFAEYFCSTNHFSVSLGLIVIRSIILNSLIASKFGVVGITSNSCVRVIV